MAGHTINISVLADTKKFSRSMKDLGQKSGLSKLGSAFKTAGSKIVGFFKTGIKWAGAFALALVGLAIKGGFERMLKIEDAEAKLKGLGHTTEAIDTIMESALNSVKGTAAGLDDAATMAANAVAAGIKPGEELTEALTLVNDAATIAGTGMGEMGSIFSKVWTSGRAQTQELNQIADRGIPIWAELADHYGVSADELRKMVSRGEVDAETFATVMNDVVGGSALEAGNTTRGAFANMRAALSRVGQAILTHVFPMFKDAFQGITVWLDDLTDKIQPLGEAFSYWLESKAVPAVRRFWAWVWPILRNLGDRIINTVVPAVRRLVDFIRDTAIPLLRRWGTWLVDNKDILLTVAAAVVGFVVALRAVNYIRTVAASVRVAAGAFRALSAAMLANPIGLIIAAIAAIAAALAWFFTQTKTGRKIWENVWGAIKSVAKTVQEWFTETLLPKIEEVWNGIVLAAQIALAWYEENIAPGLAVTVAAISAVWDEVERRAGEMWEDLKGVWLGVQLAWEFLWTSVSAFWTVYGDPILGAIGTAFETLYTIIDTHMRNIWTAIETAFTIIVGIFTTAHAVLRGDWGKAWDGLKRIASTGGKGIWTIIDRSLGAILRTFGINLDAIRVGWANGFATIKRETIKALGEIVAEVGRWLSIAVINIREFPQRARDALSRIGTTLRAAGRALIQGFINGIRDKFNDVRDTLSNLTNHLPSWKGPARRDKTLLVNAGQLVIDGFVRGLESRYGAVRRSLAGLTGMVSGTDLGTLRTPALAYAGSPTPAYGATGGVAGLAPIINVHALADGPEVGRRVVAAMREYERTNGRR